jgi:hypothetical protein
MCPLAELSKTRARLFQRTLHSTSLALTPLMSVSCSGWGALLTTARVGRISALSLMLRLPPVSLSLSRATCTSCTSTCIVLWLTCAGIAAGPVVFFDSSGAQAAVLSTMSQFMAGSVTKSADGKSLQVRMRFCTHPCKRSCILHCCMFGLQVGVMGSVSTIPAAFRLKSMLFYGPGPNAATMAWGSALLERYGKRADGPQTDFTNSYLIYNTGACPPPFCFHLM